jgi:hypothetical protein
VSASLAESSRGLGSEDDNLGERAMDHAPTKKTGRHQNRSRFLASVGI